MAREIEVHRRSGRTRRTVEGGKVRDLVEGEEGARVFLENADEALDPERALADLDDRANVHVSKCHRVMAKVRYGGPDAKSKDFAPGATIRSVFEWATSDKAWNLSPTERAKHTLQICETTNQPDPTEHIGTFADDNCGVCLDLVPKERFEG